MEKIKLVHITNPFDYQNSRKVEEVDCSDLPVICYIPQSESELIVSMNGKALNQEEQRSLVPVKGDYLTIVPKVAGGGGSGILQILAMVVLIAVAIWAAPVLAGTAGATTVWTTAAQLWFGGIMMVGSLIMGALFPQDLGDSSTSSTYGWSGINARQGQGNPVAITFGTVRTAGQVLAAHIKTVDDKQYLNLLLSGGEGELDEMTDFRIDDNQIANYTDVEVVTRLGTNDQTVIPNFNDTFADKSVSRLIEIVTEENAAIETTEGDAGEGLEIELSFSNGLCLIDKKGNAKNTSVTLSIQYRIRTSDAEVVPETWGEWTNWFSEGDKTITDNKDSTKIVTYRLDNLPRGKYQVKVKKVSQSGDTNRYINKLYWTNIAHIIYDDFVYPRTALVGITALATDQLSGGLPSITWQQKRMFVHVWNPDMASYVQKAANNPAWACYDLIHYCRKIKNINTGLYEYVVFGNSATKMDYYGFERWATFCDSIISEGLHFDMLIDVVDDFWKSIQIVEATGRGKVILRGTKYSCIFDAPATPVQQFTMGNIVQGSFSEEFLPLKDRANAIEVTFFNEEKLYERDTFVVYGDDYDDDDSLPRTSQITLYGCPRYSQAIKEGRYRLRLNKYLVRTISFEADIDAITCQVGDIINFQHDVPQWGYGGRLVSALSSTSVTLDREVTLDPGVEYTILVTMNSGLAEIHDVVGVSELTVTDTLTVAVPFNEAPAEFNPYSFGIKNIATKPFRVTNLTRSVDFRRRVTCVEYVGAVYVDDGSLPVIQYSDLGGNLRGLFVEEINDTLGRNFLHIYWSPPRISYSGATIVINGVKVAQVDSSVSSFDYQTFREGTYKIEVTPIDSLGKTGATSVINYSRTTPSDPIQVTGLSAYQAYRETGLTLGYDIILSWTSPDIFSYSNASVYVRSNTATAEELESLTIDEMADIPFERLGLDAAPWQQIGAGEDKFTFTGAVLGATYKFMIVANYFNGTSASMDTAPVIEYTVSLKQYTPVAPTGLLLEVTDKAVATWNQNTDTDIDFYELRSNKNVGESQGLLFRGLATQCSPALSSRTGTLYLYAHNPSGHYSGALSYEYNYPSPVAPVVAITRIFQGFNVATNAFPVRVNSINIHIDDGTRVVIISSVNNSYTYKTLEGIFDITVAFVDYFGEGALSLIQEQIVRPYIDLDLIEEASLSLEKMNVDVTAALEKAQTAIDASALDAALSPLEADISDITTNILPGAVSSLEGAITALDGAKASKTELTSTYNLLVQADTDNRSLITQTSSDITSIVGKLNTVALNDPTQFLAISQLHQNALGLESIVSSLSGIAAGEQESLSDVVLNLSRNPYSSALVSGKTAQGGASNTITFASDANATDSYYDEMTVTITGGTGAGQSNVVQSYVGSTKIATMKNTWGTTPNNTSVYSIYNVPSYLAISAIKQTTDTISSNVTAINNNLQGQITANTSSITQSASDIVSMVSKLALEPDAAGQYYSISKVRQYAGGIESSVTTLRSDFDTGIAAANSSITQSANNITAIVGQLAKDPYSTTDPPIYNAFSKIKQTTDAISATVATKASAASLTLTSNSLDVVIGKLSDEPNAQNQYKAISRLYVTAEGLTSTVAGKANAGDIVYLQSQISQSAGSITSIITELGKPLSQCGYTAIAQTLDNLQFRASDGTIKSLLNITPSTISILSKYVHIAGDTVFDDSVIIGRMLAANSITADKIQTGSITVGKLDSSTQNTLSAAYNTANAASGAASTAQGTANTAVSNAATAQGTANAAYGYAVPAYNTANTALSNAATAQGTANDAQGKANVAYAWRWPYDATYINGGNIYTGTITANQIAAGAITTDKLNVGSASGARTEISYNLIKVYDANNVLRVRMGVW